MPIVLVCSRRTNNILKYDGASGAYLGIFAGGVLSPQGIVVGPDTRVFFVTNNGPSIRSVSRYNADGSGFSTFASDAQMQFPIQGLAFDGTSRLYVANTSADNVLRFSASGTFDSVFASGSGLTRPTSLAFGPDGKLYVNSAATNTLAPSILRFRADGTFDQVFASGFSANGVAFGPDGNLYVAQGVNNAVLSWDSAGNLKGMFATAGGLTLPTRLRFGADGNLYVTCMSRVLAGSPFYANSSVLRYNGTTGAFLGIISGGYLNEPADLALQ